jgi:hypothetical protein
MIAFRGRHRGDDVDPSDTASGSEETEARRYLHRFLRGLSELDAALGRWRPDYGRLPAAPAPDQHPPSRAEVVEAHRLYADGLRFFADHPRAVRRLERSVADDVAAALADARGRFGAPAAPLDRLISVGGGAAPAPPGLGPPPPPPPPLAGAAAPMTTAGPRVAPSPWDAERSAAAGATDGKPNGRQAGPAVRGRDRPNGDAEPRPIRRGFAIAMSLGALVVIAVVIAAVVFGAHTLLGQGPTAGPGSAPPTQATLPASDLPSGSQLAVVAPAEACAAIPSGQVPSGLAPTGTGSGIGVDPGVGYSNPYIAVQLAGPVQNGSPAFSLIAAILPFGSTPHPSAAVSPKATPVDGAGTLQVIGYWDGSQWHGALRVWSGAAWSLSVDESSGVDVVASGSTVTLYSQSVPAGSKYGIIVATSSGCSDLGMSSALVPEESYGSQPSPG